MVTRLRASAWLRPALLVIVLACCGYGLHAEWPQVWPGLERLHWYVAAASLVTTIGGACCLMLAWRAILGDLGSPLPVRTAAKINFLAQLGKYVPGAVWAFAAQVELARTHRVPRDRSVAALIIALAVSVGSGLGLAAIALPLSTAGLSRYYWAFACVPVVAIGLCPPVLGRLIDRVLRLARRQPLEHRPSWPGLGTALAWTVAGWLLFGLQVWLLLAGMTGHRGYLLLALGGYALAFSLGVLLIVLPSGLGAREVILIATLATVLTHGTAVAIALVARVVATGADLICGGAAMLLRPKPAAESGPKPAAESGAESAAVPVGALAAAPAAAVTGDPAASSADAPAAVWLPVSAVVPAADGPLAASALVGPRRGRHRKPGAARLTRSSER